VRQLVESLPRCHVECLVNAVNTVGIMGAGLANQFANRWPAMDADYRDACRNGSLTVGKVHFRHVQTGGPIWIANVPTRADWRAPSEYSYASSGLAALRSGLEKRQLTSVVIPALGCGLGGLDFSLVMPMIEAEFAESSIEVRVHEPRPSPHR